MTTPLDDAATALVAAEEHVASITAERDALLARVNELDDEVARLVGEQQTKGGDAHAPGGRPAPGHLQVASPAPDSTSAAGVGGAPLAATAMALELVAECWKEYMKGTNPYALEHVLRAKARELREGK